MSDQFVGYGCHVNRPPSIEEQRRRAIVWLIIEAIERVDAVRCNGWTLDPKTHEATLHFRFIGEQAP